MLIKRPANMSFNRMHNVWYANCVVSLSAFGLKCPVQTPEVYPRSNSSVAWSFVEIRATISSIVGMLILKSPVHGGDNPLSASLVPI